MKQWLFILEAFPVQYHAPVYRALARIAKDSGSGAGLQVYYATDATLRGKYDAGFGRVVAWDEPLLDGYLSRVLSGREGRRMLWILHRDRPAAVLLTQFNHRLCWTAYISCLLLGIPLWIRTETQDEAFARSAAKERIRGLFYKLLYAAVDHCFAIGVANRQHYLRHAVSSKMISNSPYCVADRFAGMSPRLKTELRSQIRQQLGLNDRQVVLLFCGKLQSKKNPGCILDAMHMLSPAERESFAVLFVGSGEEEGGLREQARSMADVCVRFAGFKNQSELPPYYLASDVLILPSRQMGETWGLVVNEALLADLRVVVSPFVGCLADFKRVPSVTSFDGTPADLGRALRELPAGSTAIRNRAFMADYSVERAAEAIWHQLLAQPKVEICA